MTYCGSSISLSGFSKVCCNIKLIVNSLENGISQNLDDSNGEGFTVPVVIIIEVFHAVSIPARNIVDAMSDAHGALLGEKGNAISVSSEEAGRL